MNMLVVFICENAQEALDLAKEEGLEMPPASVVEVPCSGRVDEVSLLRTFRQGASAVLVVGCLPGNCRYRTGNCEARRTVEEARATLRQVGVAEERLEMLNIAPIQHAKLLGMVREMSARAERLGPIAQEEGQ